MKTGMTAFTLGFSLYLLPYVWAYSPALLGVGSIGEVVFVTLSATLGCYAFVAAIQGWLLERCTGIERIVLALAGFGMVHVAWETDLAGLLIFLAVLGRQWSVRRVSRQEAGETGS
jgi:TRAP-type uncharacterized transport system fused permease subunit